MKFNAILLAGGLSSRMGTNKALLLHKNKTLLQGTYDKIKSVINGLIVVSGNYSDFLSVPDEKPAQGPIEGIWSCVQKMDFNRAVLVVPVDMPFLKVESLRELIDQFQDQIKDQSTAQMFLQFEDFEMPFVFIYNETTKQVLSEVRKREDASLRSIRYFKKQLAEDSTFTSSLPVLDNKNFKNVNTPQDWEEACR